ncbi:MAG: hypothetical protein Q8910_09890 [Bacteroidota bacterium]|nr:hypothetical protein [Bacteroidota bacterium]MDP4226679.1 hypothetical protein [Bacteroidota bacterium]
MSYSVSLGTKLKNQTISSLIAGGNIHEQDLPIHYERKLRLFYYNNKLLRRDHSLYLLKTASA